MDIQNLSQISDENQKTFQRYFNKALLCQAENNIPLAIKLYEKALSYQPLHLPSLQVLAHLLTTQGQFEKAKMKTEVTIKEIYLAYYAKPGCLPQSHIDPVYLFKGDYRTSGRIKEREIKDGDSFEIIISAVPKPTE